MKYFIAVFSILCVYSCSTKHNSDVDLPAPQFKVEHSGALKDMMHKGDLTAKADLNNFTEAESFYALGALENLKGEIQIFNSEPFNTLVEDSALVFDKSYNKKASLLVYASVKKWDSIPIPADVKTQEQLQDFLEETADSKHINTSEPFPFLIEGSAESIDWHVINWKDGDTEHSHEKHISSGLHGTIKNRPVILLGFYSDAHHAIFTHHTTNMHIHVKTSACLLYTSDTADALTRLLLLCNYLSRTSNFSILT